MNSREMADVESIRARQTEEYNPVLCQARQSMTAQSPRNINEKNVRISLYVMNSLSKRHTELEPTQ